jgi:hypothetical protein
LLGPGTVVPRHGPGTSNFYATPDYAMQNEAAEGEVQSSGDRLADHCGCLCRNFLPPVRIHTHDSAEPTFGSVVKGPPGVKPAWPFSLGPPAQKVRRFFYLRLNLLDPFERPILDRRSPIPRSPAPIKSARPVYPPGGVFRAFGGCIFMTDFGTILAVACVVMMATAAWVALRQ